MAAVSYASLRRALGRGDIAPVYYVTGDEEILKDELVGAIVDTAVDPASRDFNVDFRSAGDLNGETLNSLVETPPMLAERRVAVVRGLEQWRKNSKIWQVLENYVARPSPTTVLVMILGPGHEPDKALAGRATHVAVNTPDMDTMREWAVSRTQRHDLVLTAEAADHLLHAVGGNLSQAAVEIDKLGAAVESGTVTVPDIERFVGVRHGETLSDWVEAVVTRDIALALGLLDVVLPQPGITAVKMLTTLGTTLVGARLTRGLADRGRGAGARQVKDALWQYLKRVRPRGIGKYSEEIERWMSAARRWSAADLDRALEVMYECDGQLKSTTISDPRATLTHMLLRFAKPKEAA